MRSVPVALLALLAAVPVLSTSATGGAFCSGLPGRHLELLGPTTVAAGDSFVLTIGQGGAAEFRDGDWVSELPSILTLRGSACRGMGCPVQVSVDELASNLYRVVVPASLAPGEYRVNELGRAMHISVVHGPRRPAISEAPRIARLDGFRNYTSGVTLELDTAAPIEAVGVVVQWSDTRYFARTHPRAPNRFVVKRPRCWPTAPAVPPFRAGERVEVRFVDAAGRLSPQGSFAVSESIEP